MSLICQAGSSFYLSHALTDATRLHVDGKTLCTGREMGPTNPDIKFALETILISPYQLQIKMRTFCPPCEIYEIVLIVQIIFVQLYLRDDRLCGLVVRVLGYRSGGPGSITGTTRKKKVVAMWDP
jgi:hypothetical protein